MVIDCPRCGRKQVEASETDTYICVDCAKTENTRISYIKRASKDDWLAVAKEAGIELYQRQPEETDWEYGIWVAYRDCYPSTKPTYRLVAETLNTTYSAVKHVGTRWSYSVRMQAWIKYCDDLSLATRRTEILEMNSTHINMAKNLNKKLETAIRMLEPASIKPAEIGTLMRTAAELERKAQLEGLSQDTLLREEAANGGNKEIKKHQKIASADDLSEIVGILAGAGILNGVSITKTTEVKVGDSPIDVDCLEEMDE